jgi:N-acetylmuramoyl-L-alanine amidase
MKPRVAALFLALSLTASGCADARRAPRPAPHGGPKPLAGHSIVLDPGHGLNPQDGMHTGAQGVNGAWEDDNVLDIGKRLAPLLRSEGATVDLTRTTAWDPGPPPIQGLIDRVRFAEQKHPQIFISIHENDSPNHDPTERGGMTWYWRPDSSRLAVLVQGEMVRTAGLKDDGVRQAPFYVIKNTTMPAVLVEGGFLSNASEAQLITSPAFHAREADALNRAILEYFGKLAVPTGTGSAPPAWKP